MCRLQHMLQFSKRPILTISIMATTQFKSTVSSGADLRYLKFRISEINEFRHLCNS
jgi:hypothetical protein